MRRGVGHRACKRRGSGNAGERDRNAAPGAGHRAAADCASAACGRGQTSSADDRRWPMMRRTASLVLCLASVACMAQGSQPPTTSSPRPALAAATVAVQTPEQVQAAVATDPLLAAMEAELQREKNLLVQPGMQRP